MCLLVSKPSVTSARPPMMMIRAARSSAALAARSLGSRDHRTFLTSAFQHVTSRTRTSVVNRGGAMSGLGGVMQQYRSLFIQSEPTPNPLAMKFIPHRDGDVLEGGGTMTFNRGSVEARKSPLAWGLFKNPNITSVFLGKDFITITAVEDADWGQLKVEIYTAIMEFYASGKPIVADYVANQDTLITDEDDEVVAMIKELIETRIRPTVQDDGGDILFRNFDTLDGTVYVELAGSCSGCPSSSVTLKNGVENMLMHYIPEVKCVEEVITQAQTEGQKEFDSLEARLATAGLGSTGELNPN